MQETGDAPGQEQGSVGGGWLGTYAYKGVLGAQPPVRFEAVFAEPDAEGRFSGTILDDGDASGLREATATGGQSGRGIRFSKSYRRGGPPVSYEGTLADDGRTMQGTWRIASVGHGVWDARRLWSESAGDDAETEGEEREAAHDAPRVREVVRLA